jgi:general secretion pathway protein J
VPVARNRNGATRQQAGFTLLEVLIAIAIFAGIFLIAQQLLSQSIAQRDRLDEEAARMEAQQLLLTWMTLDFEQIIARPVRDALGTPQPAIVGRQQGVAFTRTGWANPFALRQRSSLQRVEYFLKDEQLVRWHWPVLDPNQGVEPVEMVMLDGVEDFQVRFLSKSSAAGYQWTDIWPDQATLAMPPVLQPLPDSIEVTVFLASGHVLHRFYRVVANPWQ